MKHSRHNTRSRPDRLPANARASISRTASRVVDALERNGFVKRSRHERDGRALALSVRNPDRRVYRRIEADILTKRRYPRLDDAVGLHRYDRTDGSDV